MFVLRQISNGRILKQRRRKEALKYLNIHDTDLEWVSLYESSKPSFDFKNKYLKFTDENEGDHVNRSYLIVTNQDIK